jgi:enoyl-CoA hydratase
MTEVVQSERHGAVALLRLNRPEALNALSDDVLAALCAALDAAEESGEVRSIVLCGAGRAFAAGADVAGLRKLDAAEVLEGERGRRWQRLRSSRLPVVAAVHGWCLGGGCELAMTCDLIVASHTARFGQPETGLGIIPGAGGTQRLARAVGKALAMDMVLTGRVLSAEEAHSAGLVARVVAKEAWLDEARRVASEIAARAPVAQRLARESVDRAFETGLDSGLDFERKALYLAFASEDAREGLSAFVEKRRPEWKSR